MFYNRNIEGAAGKRPAPQYNEVIAEPLGLERRLLLFICLKNQGNNADEDHEELVQLIKCDLHSASPLVCILGGKEVAPSCEGGA